MFDFGKNNKRNDNSSNTETSALVAPSTTAGNGPQQQYYFVGKASNDYQGGTSESVRDNDGGEVVEEIPAGSTTDEFAPKRLVPSASTPSTQSARNVIGRGGGATNHTNHGGGFWSKLFGGSQSNTGPTGSVEGGSLVKPRKAPIKIEPKVFFANERTFLAWMHLSVTLAGASIAILAFAEEQNPYSQLYGVLLLPVAIAFIVYSMYQYSRRAAMIRSRHPGPYEDTVGPAVLGIMLMVSIVAQFALKLYSMTE